jgi:hypothetical protein
VFYCGALGLFAFCLLAGNPCPQFYKVAECSGPAGLRSSRWWPHMASRRWPPLRGSPVRCCCCPFRSACGARPARRSPRPTCCTTWPPRPARCTGTGGRDRPAAGSSWCSSPGTAPGVLAGSVIRVELLPSPQVFDLVVAAVLVPLGIGLALIRPGPGDNPRRPARLIPASVLVFLAAALPGCRGGLRRGIYGIGGGSILAPVLIGTGRRALGGRSCRPGVNVRDLGRWRGHLHHLVDILSIHEPGSVAPDWPVGVALGVGGLAGAYTGARLQSRLSRGGFSVTFMLVPVRLRGSRPRRWSP